MIRCYRAEVRADEINFTGMVPSKSLLPDGRSIKLYQGANDGLLHIDIVGQERDTLASFHPLLEEHARSYFRQLILGQQPVPAAFPNEPQSGVTS